MEQNIRYSLPIADRVMVMKTGGVGYEGDPEPLTEPTIETPAPAVVATPGLRLQDDLDEQLLPIFLEEAQDQLSELTVQLRLWRGDLDSDAQPHAVARLLHTFKGNARMAGAMNLGEFTHLLESRVEDILRAGTATPA